MRYWIKGEVQGCSEGVRIEGDYRGWSARHPNKAADRGQMNCA
jgi:hypothetical protein